MRLSVYSVMSTEHLISLSGKAMRNIMLGKLKPSVLNISQMLISGVLSNIISTFSFLKYATMRIPVGLSLRETCLSVSVVQASMHGSILSFSIWIHRQVLRLMHSLLMVRTGVSLLITGKRWRKTVMHGGSLVLPKCQNISMHSA